MSKVKVILLLVALALCSLLNAQSQSDSLSKMLHENNKVIKTMLDYRYKGGSGAFERDFFVHVDYNKISRQSCTLGTTIMMFTVHCDGTLGEFNILNPLNDHINSQLQKFFLMTKDKWNECQNSDYEYFEIPIVFTIEGLETEAVGFITHYDEEIGYPCKDDSYFHDVFNKYKDKKPKKAIKALDELIRRNPYNDLYILEKDSILEKLRTKS
ncbi:MAG: hypothetical protein IIX06_00405 [Bacteroidales bacterium]|nr:hypothetical protein [Bacteroidales bacterium]